MNKRNPLIPLYQRGTTALVSPTRLALFLMVGCSALTSCGGNSQKPAATAEPQPVALAPVVRITIPRDSVVVLHIPSDTSQTYSIYYPAKAKSLEYAPILVCFDPHGDGRIPIDKYRKWADKYGVAIAGSNSSRNGLSAADGLQIAGNMISDISSRLGFDQKNMALCGFSGGAKVAINAIVNNSVISNLIYAGAVTQLSTSRPINVLGFAGNQDMNYTDLLQFDESIRASNPNSTLIEFNGKHEWPDAKVFERVFCWLSFQIWRQNPAAKDSAAIKTFAQNSNKAIAEDEKQNDWVKAHEDCQAAYTFLNGLTDVSSYRTKMDAIANNDKYKKALAEKNQILDKESNEKSVLMQAFQTQGAEWWGKVISGYQASIKPSDKRLLGFISLASYSYSNQLLQQHNLDGAERILTIYELADPTNTDQLFFHAMLYAEKNNNALAIKYLQKAVANKFTDWRKVEAEPAFSPLRGDPAYGQIVAALKKASR